jgi:hypothetical protein
MLDLFDSDKSYLVLLAFTDHVGAIFFDVDKNNSYSNSLGLDFDESQNEIIVCPDPNTLLAAKNLVGRASSPLRRANSGFHAVSRLVVPQNVAALPRVLTVYHLKTEGSWLRPNFERIASASQGLLTSRSTALSRTLSSTRGQNWAADVIDGGFRVASSMSDLSKTKASFEKDLNTQKKGSGDAADYIVDSILSYISGRKKE